MNEWMNEWKRLLAQIKNIKLHTNNNIKQYIHQRCYQVTKNIYGDPWRCLKLVKEDHLRCKKRIVKHKLSHAGHLLRGSSRDIIWLILEGTIFGRKVRGRPRRIWMDDICEYTAKRTYGEVKRLQQLTEKCGGRWSWHTNLPIKEDGTKERVII